MSRVDWGAERLRREEGAPTDRQLRVLRFIADGTAGGFIPSIREICSALGFASTNAAMDHLRALEVRGLVDRGFRKARCLRVTPRGMAHLKPSKKVCPTCGHEVRA